MKVTPTKIILTSADNMNSVLNEKCRLSPNDMSEKFRTLFNFHRIERTKKIHDRLGRYDKKHTG